MINQDEIKLPGMFDGCILNKSIQTRYDFDINKLVVTIFIGYRDIFSASILHKYVKSSVVELDPMTAKNNMIDAIALMENRVVEALHNEISNLTNNANLQI